MTERDCVISSSVPAHTMPDGSSMMSGSLNARLQEMWFPTWEQVALNAAGTGGFRVLGSMDCLAVAGGASDKLTRTAPARAATSRREARGVRRAVLWTFQPHSNKCCSGLRTRFMEHLRGGAHPSAPDHVRTRVVP